METGVRVFFQRYESLFNRALGGDAKMEEVAALYASDFIASTPAAVMTGKNDEYFRQAMEEGYARYRAMGTKAMRIRGIRLSSVDAHHCVAHVAWTAIHARKDGTDLAIEFEVHYFVRMVEEEPKVFGWVSGDEEALLRKHGII